MKKASTIEVKDELQMLGNIWKILKEVIDSHANSSPTYREVLSVGQKMLPIVTECNSCMRSFAEQIAQLVIGYISMKQFRQNHTREAIVFNIMSDLLKAGYWIGTGDDESVAKDWNEFINMARVKAHYFDNDTAISDFAISIIVACIDYVADHSASTK